MTKDNNSELIRLQKYISDCGIMSRRAAEREIDDGRVTVNGTVAHLGQKIDPRRDEVRIGNRKITKKRDHRYTYVLLNKPSGYLSTASDDRERKCVTELVKSAGARLYPVGRLDMHSEGLLLLTNDGELTQRMTHPSYDCSKIYHVLIRGDVSAEKLHALGQPMEIDDYTIKPVECHVVNQTDKRTIIEMTLTEGRNRQIRKMCEQVGLEIAKLRRVAIVSGECALKLDKLRLSEWRYLTRDEVAALKGGAK